MAKKTVVITGGNRGIGLGITRAFVGDGYHVVVGSRQKTEDLDAFGNTITFVAIDVRDEGDHLKLAVAAQEKTGRLDAYVNNAGFSEWRPIDQIDDAFLSNILATNLKGTFWGCKAAAATLGDGGAIVNVSSIAGKRGSSNNSAYVASKFGVNGLTQSLAKELGPRGIRVNAVCPVLVSTVGLREALQGEHAPAGGDPDKFLADFRRANAALGRLPTAEEVGEMCLFLASDRASAITGQCINVDCGVFPQ
jgi:3-oxoacyl-[acyl-carrier protein] reductase/meso-butanediol dehydrogenase/(S,S)-butanediol dehydrogenase/diacetyl reductase